jgi:hypothetical protein
MLQKCIDFRICSIVQVTVMIEYYDGLTVYN